MSQTYTIKPASGDSFATVFLDSSLKTKIGTLNEGTTINVLGSQSNAYKIDYETGNGEATTGIVKVNSTLNVREGPGMSFKKIGSMSNGTSVTIIRVNGDWMQVNGGGYTNAWVAKQYIQTTDSTTYGWVSKTDVKVNTTQTTADDGSDWKNSQVYKDSLAREKVDAQNYAYTTEKRYLGTEDYYKEMMTKLNYCFG